MEDGRLAAIAVVEGLPRPWNPVWVGWRAAKNYFKTFLRVGDAAFVAHARTDIPALIVRVEQLEAALQTVTAERDAIYAAVREHRDARGDDRCWMDDEALYAALPEGYTPPARDSAVELERCRQFIASRQHPQTVYVSPQRAIEAAEAARDEARQQATVEDRALSVTRVEVINATGRVYGCRPCEVELSFQDEGRTLKVFVKPLP